MHFRSLLLVFAWLLSSRVQAQDSTLTRFIRQNSYSFAPQAGQFAGVGWEQLQAAIRASQFVLVGEDHGLAEIPGFTAAVAQVLAPKAFVAEINTYEAQTLNELAAQPGLPRAYQQQYPFSLSFYSWTEEFQLIQALHARGVPVLGVDQLYLGNAGHLVAQMAEQARGKAAKAYLRAQAAAYLASERGLYEQSGKGTLRFTTLPQAAMDSLLAVAATQRPAVQRMAHELALSHAIARSYVTRAKLPTGLTGHQTRVNLMKRNLLQQLQPYRQAPAQPFPKLLFKFGTNHVGRDRAVDSNIPDIGSLMANLADAQDQQSLHVMVMGKQGTQNVRDTFDHAKNIGPLTPQDNPYLQLFYDQTGSSWNLVDLRPARRALTSHQLQLSSPVLERVILGYDYLVVIPQTTASGNY